MERLSIYYTDSETQEGIGMARGQRKTIEAKIAEKERLIESLKLRLKSEQQELDALNKEKRDEELQALSDVLQEAKLTAQDAAGLIREYLQERKDPA